MAELGSYYVTVMPNMKQFNQTLASAAKTSGTNAGGIFNTAFGVALGSLASGAIRTAFGSLESGIARLDTLENFPRVMENIGIATEDVARSAVKDLAQRLEGLPTRLDDATASVQRFALANGDIETSVEMFDALNNALLSGGSGAELQAAALEQVSQAYAKGKPDMMEWRSMLQTMGPALQMVAASWNMSVEDMGEALRQGEIPMQDFFDTLIELNGEGINGLASLSEQASVSTESLGTALGLISTRISNAWAQILDAIGREDLVAIIDGATSGMLDAVSTYIVPAVKEAKQAFDGFVEATKPIQDALADFFTLILDNLDVVVTLVGAFAAFNGVMALAPVITAIAGAITSLVTGIGAVVGAFAALGEGIALVVGGAATVGEVFALLGASLFPIVGVIAAIGVAIALNWDTVSAWLQDLGAGFAELGEWFGSVLSAADTFFGSTIPAAIDSGLRKIGSYFSNGIAGWKSIFDTFLNGIKSIPGKIVSFFTGIGSKITSAIGNIHFPMPHVTWEEVGLGIKLPKVKWYAQGGFVNGAQLIGAGEKGTELIWPSYGAALDKYGAAIASHMNGAGTVYNVYMNDVAVNDNAAIRADVMQLLMDMQRYGAMNRG